MHCRRMAERRASGAAGRCVCGGRHVLLPLASQCVYCGMHAMSNALKVCARTQSCLAMTPAAWPPPAYGMRGRHLTLPLLYIYANALMRCVLYAYVITYLRGAPHPTMACRYLYLRLKERHFLAPPQPALTISGFYYLCLDRHTGRLTGQYYDAASSPFELDMQIRGAVHGGGFAFPSYEMA